MNVFLMGVVFASSALAIAAAAAVLIRSWREAPRRWLAMLLICAAVWTTIVNLQIPGEPADYNIWVIRLTFIAALGMIYAMVNFTVSITELKLSPAMRRSMTAATALALVVVASPYMITGVDSDSVRVIPHRTVLYDVVLAIICWQLITSIVVVVRAVRSKQRGRRLRFVVLALGLAGGVVAGVTTNIILPNVTGSIAPARYAWIALLIWTVTLVYAVMRHRLLDVRMAVVRSVAYFLVLLSLISVYFGLALALTWVLPVSATPALQVAENIAIALVLALLFQPIKYFFDRLTQQVFYRDMYSSDDFFARLNRELGATSDLRRLLSDAATAIGSTMSTEQSMFCIHHADDRIVVVGTLHHSQLTPSDNRRIMAYIMQHGDAVTIVDDITDDQLRKFFRSHRIALILPLKHADTLLGYLLLGERRSGFYTARDVRILDTIADELAIAIQNALAVQEVRELNASLQQRINDATKELRASNRQLQQLDEAKDEFVSMASHQLRTPLTSVKGYIDMVLQGDAGKITPMQRQLLSEAFASSERMVHLINDFLNVSRLQTGKFMLDRRPIDLAKVIGQEVDSLRTTASARNLTLEYRPSSRLPILYLDEDKLRQVVMNFLDNAIYYSREHSTIKVYLKSEDGDVMLEVRDTGIGVPKAEQAHLFTKFFRATNARKQRPDGTGVGLYLAKRVVTDHGGSIVFSSTEGEGSVFGFRLPIKRLSAAPADDTN